MIQIKDKKDNKDINNYMCKNVTDVTYKSICYRSSVTLYLFIIINSYSDLLRCYRSLCIGFFLIYIYILYAGAGVGVRARGALYRRFWVLSVGKSNKWLLNQRFIVLQNRLFIVTKCNTVTREKINEI